MLNDEGVSQGLELLDPFGALWVENTLADGGGGVTPIA